MASTNRSASDSLALYQRLAEQVHKYGFFKAVQLLEQANPQGPGLGRSSRPKDDPVRLGQRPHMEFAPSTLAEFATATDTGMPPRLSVYFFGLFGPNGPLPHHLTEQAQQQIRNDKEASFAHFADLFHHRLLSLFYRAWAEARPQAVAQDDFARWIDSLFGSGVETEKTQDGLPGQAQRFYAARFADQHRSPEGLQAILTQYFSIPVQLQQFVGQTLNIPKPYQMQLGKNPEYCALGVSSTLGTQVWECQSKFRLTLGPLEQEDYLAMLPGGRYLAQLTAIVSHYIGNEFDWDIHLVLGHQAMRSARLGQFNQLGWTTWLFKAEFSQPQHGLYIDPKRQRLH